MSANDNIRYFWLKLPKTFFQQHQIKVLKSLPNGRLYALIYLELLAESTSHSGELRYSKLLPYDINTLASVIDEDVDSLRCAIEILTKLELVEILEDKTIYMKEIAKLVGSSTGQTIRKTMAKMEEGKNYPLITKKLPKRIEYRDKSIDNKEIYKETKHKYGTYKNVLLSDEELEKLKQEFPDYEKRIERVSEYCASKGKSYKNYLATIRSWARKEEKPKTIDSMYDEVDMP